VIGGAVDALAFELRLPTLLVGLMQMMMATFPTFSSAWLRSLFALLTLMSAVCVPTFCVPPTRAAGFLTWTDLPSSNTRTLSSLLCISSLLLTLTRMHVQVLGPNVKIGDGCRLQRCTIMEGSMVKGHAWVDKTIVGWRSTVGAWSRLENVTVLGEDVAIKDELYMNGVKVLPHKTISESIPEPRVVM
jgi:hypothetical protein